MVGDTTVDRETFRAVMRKHAAGVTVITTAHDGRLHGMTATAFCSVSADPPTILIVVNRAARSHPLIHGSGTFAVNLLASGQRALAERFSGKREEKFDGLAFHLGRTGVPILAGVVAYLECRVAGRTEVETHSLFLGRVVDGGVGDGASLIYAEGGYLTASRAEA